MKRELIYMDAKSSKFWTIEQEGASHTVTYGRIGSKGQSSTKTFADEAAATKDAEKLIKEKVGKGYVDAAQGETAEGSDEIPFVAFTGVARREDIYNNAGTFVGQRVVDYDPEKPAKSGVAYRFRSDWDDTERAIQGLTHFLATDVALEATALVIGAWQGDDSSLPPDDVIKTLVDGKDRLPRLAALYVGDIVSEENEMSWIHQSDLSPLLAAFPSLQLLRARGGEGMKFSEPRHSGLRALILETGGMDRSVVQSLGTAAFPKLEYLELWLGTDEYGGDVTVDDLRPILLGETFPDLKYLGLRNSEIVDALAPALVESFIVKHIETLDLSLGTLSDVGGTALLELTSPTLQRLNLHHNYMSAGLAQKLKALPFTVDTNNPSNMEDDEEYRFVAVGE